MDGNNFPITLGCYWALASSGPLLHEAQCNGRFGIADPSCVFSLLFVTPSVCLFVV